MKNTDRTVAFLLQSAEMLICFLLFQQIVICEVVDAHGVTNIVQCFGGGFSGCGAAFFQDVVYVRQVFLPHFTAVTDRLKFGLNNVIQEFLYFYIAQATALIVGFQFIQVVVVRQEFFKVFRATECVQIDEYRVAFHFSGILHTDVVRISEHGHDLGSDIFRFVGQAMLFC